MRALGIVLLVGCALAIAACSRADVPSSEAARMPPVSYSGPLPPLPPPEYPLPRSRDVVHAVYEFAGRRPDVLHYMPCFCGCQASGHVGNDDCFVRSRDASGRPIWDLHGMG